MTIVKNELFSTVTVYQGAGKNRVITPPGEPLDLSEAEAEDLRDRGKLVQSGPGEEGAPQVVVRPEGEDLMRAIVEVIPDLDGEEGFTKSGVPNVSSLKDALGYEVTGKERDEAWDAYQAKLDDQQSLIDS